MKNTKPAKRTSPNLLPSKTGKPPALRPNPRKPPAKIAHVCKDPNGKWIGFSLPLPAEELYGSDEDGEAACTTKRIAIKACKDAGVTEFVTEKQLYEIWV